MDMLKIRPTELRIANEFIAAHHRHHKPVQGHRFSISVWDADNIVGVATIGRPVARLAGNPLEVLEITRLCTDGTKNACSKLYSAAARIGKEMGYKRIQTYILESEPGTSLLAAGWKCERITTGDTWTRKNRSRRTDQPTCPKQRWAKILSAGPR